MSGVADMLRKRRRVWKMLVIVGVGIVAGVVLVWMRETQQRGVDVPHLLLGSHFLQVHESQDYHDVLHEKRRHILQETCKRLNFSNMDIFNFNPKKFDHIYVNDDYKFLYCSIPKVACSSGKRALLGLTGVENSDKIPFYDLYNPHGKYFKTLEKMKLSRYSSTDVMLRLRIYKKFVIVRDPYERILSAWRNKLVDKNGLNSDFQRRYGTFIVKKYRENATREAMTQGKDVTFREFVRYLIDPQTEKAGMNNDHWQSYTTLCYPCIVNYDFILKFETLAEDIAYVRNKLNLDNFKFPNRSLWYEHKPTSTLVDGNYAEIPLNFIEGINEKFKTDFIMFNYSYYK